MLPGEFGLLFSSLGLRGRLEFVSCGMKRQPVCMRIVDWCHRASMQTSSCHDEHAMLVTNVPTAESFDVGAGGHGGISRAPHVAIGMWEGSFGHSW